MLDAWLARKRRDGQVRMTTLTCYDMQSRSLKAGLGAAFMIGLDRRAVVAYVKARVAAGRSGATIEDEINILRMGLKYAITRGWWRGDALRLTANLDLADPPEKTWLRADEATLLLKHLDMDAFGMAARMAMLAGMRAGEVASRQWSDVDFAGSQILVGPKVTKTWSWKTKNGRKRYVPMGADLRDALRRWHLKLGRPDGSAWVIPTSDGQRRRSIGWFAHKLNAACETAGIRQVSFHGLRHSFASLSLQSGASLFEVSKMLGHQSMEFTAEVYGHVDNRQLTRAVNTLGASLMAQPLAISEGACE